ncbi:FAD binding domain-containing protein [Cupriavidus basilensis]
MKPTSFEYRRPGTLDDALRLLAQSGPDAKVIAGGQSLVPMMNFRMARPDVLIDINGVSELDYHRRDGDILRIGALMRHADLKDSALVQECCPLMSEAYHYVAHGTVRNRRHPLWKSVPRRSGFGDAGSHALCRGHYGGSRHWRRTPHCGRGLFPGHLCHGT